MNTILLLLIFTGLVGMLLVVFFMLDRVNDIHKHSDIPQRGHVDPAAVFGGLTGKNLWDALIGVPMPGWDQKRLAAIRPRYDLVLQKHLELLFEDGKLDGREGFAMPVRCDRMVPTLRGEIESWIPHEFASGIYRAGFAIATTPEENQEPIRQQIDMVGDALFAAAGLPPHPLSAILMPQLDRPKRPDEEEANEDTQASDQAIEADGEQATAESADGIAALPAPETTDEAVAEVPPADQALATETDSSLAAENETTQTAATAEAGEPVPQAESFSAGEPLEAPKAEAKVNA